MTDVTASPAPPPGVRAATVGDGGEDRYYTGSRPDLRAMIPHRARRALDVGCGAGALGAALKLDTGAEVHGIEVFEAAADIAQTRLDGVLRVDLQRVTELPYPPAHFDVITFGDVLEHMHDPHGLLRLLRTHLTPDGVIVCSIPNVKHWSVVADLLLNDRWRYADQGLLDRTHVHFFTLAEIDEMLRETGLDVIELRTLKSGPMPEGLRALADLAGALGGDRDEALARLDAYQYLVAARPVAAR
jgi:2-polyprenyl-3-methyl-5-hydroxy-6-metoxy-1,4-benzoquinol methylase